MNKSYDKTGPVVKLTYFKPNGKYYSEGSYMSTNRLAQQIVSEVKELRKHKRLPGVGGSNWHVMVDVDGLPHLLLAE